MQEIYVQGDSANLAIMIQYGVEYILVQYTGDDLTSIRIASKVRRLLALSGLDYGRLVTPDIQELADLTMDYSMGVLGAFVGGMRMV